MEDIIIDNDNGTNNWARVWNDEEIQLYKMFFYTGTEGGDDQLVTPVTYWLAKYLLYMLSGDLVIWGRKYLVAMVLVLSGYQVTVHYPCDILRHRLRSYFHLDQTSQLSNYLNIFNILFLEQYNQIGP